MPRDETTVLRPSILDRLDSRATTTGSYGSVTEYRNAVLRDVEWILNHRRTTEPAPESLPLVRESVYHYGLPDLTSLSADSAEIRNQLRRVVEEAVRIFEPRLESVRVRIPEEDTPLKGVRFVIEGLLRMDPHPQRVAFDTVLESASGTFKVSAHA